MMYDGNTLLLKGVIGMTRRTRLNTVANKVILN